MPLVGVDDGVETATIEDPDDDDDDDEDVGAAQATKSAKDKPANVLKILSIPTCLKRNQRRFSKNPLLNSNLHPN
jgi:hypothetical protein